MLHALPRLASALARRGVSSSALAALPRVNHQALFGPGDIERVNEDGAIVIRQALAEPWLEVLAEAAEANLNNPGPLCDEHASANGTGGRFHDDQFLWHRHPAFEEYVLRSGIGALAARAMHSKTAHILYDQLFVKEPGTPSPTPWHNDTSYWHLRGKQICSVWLALDEVPRERGLSYVKGSHRWGLCHRITNFSGSDDVDSKNVYPGAENFPPVPDVDAGVARGEYELLSWDMVPGDVLVFYSAMMHGAPGNPAHSKHRRRGYATRWCGDDIFFEDRIGTMHRGWKAAGFDNGLQNGDHIGCSLHPNVVRL
mmetsp:Transcript_147111/g.274000  ORF Transcript_147111/g.274000 Transcript_147111/m.274000 type:complete len:312 (+) Transcript_147111:50-985(+)